MCRYLYLVFLISCFYVNIVVSRDEEYYEYMKKFGFMDKFPTELGKDEPANMVVGRQKNSAIIAFQMYYGLPLTGRIDRATRDLMSKPRCGVPDLPNKAQYRYKRQISPLPFTHLGTKWNSNYVTWKINSFTRQLSQQEQRSAFYRAFKLWSDVTPLTISQVSGGKADMEISFERYDHGDNSPFDGKGTANGNTLAHAFQPGTADISGDTHFDDDETWTVNSDTGTDLYYAAAHEFGHALGLGHSNRPEALMYPLYRDASNLKLSNDDIGGIQRLYGSQRQPIIPTARPTRLPRTFRPSFTLRPRPTPRPRVTMGPRYTVRPVRTTTTELPTTTAKLARCNVKIDQILEGSDGRYFVFENDVVHIVKDGNHESMIVDEVFESAPRQPDLAFTTPRKDKVYIVKDSSVWRYSSQTTLQLDEGYPLQINNDRFPETPRFVLSFMDDFGRSRSLIFGSTKWWEYDFDDVRYMSIFSYDIDYNFYNMPRDIKYVIQKSEQNMFYLITDDRYDILNTNRRSIVENEGDEGLPEVLNNVCNVIQRNTARYENTAMYENTAASIGRIDMKSSIVWLLVCLWMFGRFD